MVATTKEKPTPTAKARPASTGALIDRLWATREQKRDMETKLKEIELSIKDQEEALMERLGAEGLEKATGTKASVSVTKTIVADVQDWDAFWPYIAKNKYWHLVQKRASDPGVRELWDAGKKVPGVVPFTKSRVNVRTLS